MIILPDAVAVSVAWLNATPAVTAIFGNRIGTELPAEDAWPALRIDPTGGVAVLEYRIDQSNLQIHSFATSDIAAMADARTARAAFAAMAGYRRANECVVVDVVTSSPQLINDPARTPPISHATFAATVTIRPDP